MSTLAPVLTAEDELHWLALKMVPGLGARTAQKLLERFRTPQRVLRAARSELEASGVSGSVAQSIASGCSFEDAVVQQEKMRQAGAQLITLTDPRYPERLREIFDPPVTLFLRGRVELLESLLLGVVGTRRPTPYGLAVSERLSGDLARAGLSIISGMARGIDTAAHRGALAACGSTVAVLGCGVDVVYPSENRKLAAEIVEKGLLVSEFPMGAPAYPQNFPIRNRIISGASIGVLVVEGAQYSGSSITARLALEQGRDVFAVPGSILSKMSWGPNLLIKQGAKLIQDWNDVVVELAPDHRRALTTGAQGRLFGAGEEPSGATSASKDQDVPSHPVARQVLELLSVETPMHIDDLMTRAEDVSSSEVIAALFELEMAGAIRQLPGKNFVRVW
ncbi:MAG TPA: DNA-processing protein DprA [Bryobacteraceae bacterium]